MEPGQAKESPLQFPETWAGFPYATISAVRIRLSLGWIVFWTFAIVLLILLIVCLAALLPIGPPIGGVPN